jgi:CubicO group peptidase (beta-lactamase class C family)
MRSILLILPLVVITPALAFPDDAAQDDLLPMMERVVTTAVDPDGPGAAVLVIKDDKVLLKKGYGMADVDKKTPVTTETTFELASGSKPITALAILLLELAGKLALADDIRKYVPELPVYDEKRPIQLTDLLHHTSGLPDPIGSGTIREGTTADLVKWAADRKLDFPTGTRKLYCNMGYRLLALVVERVTGKSFGTYVHDEIFAPLGMKRTVVRETAKITPADHARGYSLGGLLDGGKKYRLSENPFILIGEAGVWSCVDDMQKLDAALRGGKLLKAETLKRAWTPGKLDDGKETDYGLGWYVNKGLLGPQIWHSGGWPGGYMTQHLRLVDKGVSVIVLRNLYNVYNFEGRSPTIQLAERLASVVLDGPPAVKDSPTAAQRKQLAGVYQLEGVKTPFTATVIDGKDGLTLVMPKEEPWAMVPVGPLRFALLGLGDRVAVTFTMDGDKVKTLTLEYGKAKKSAEFHPALASVYAVKDFDKDTADKVAGKVWLAELPIRPGSKEVLRIVFRFTVQDGLLTGVLDNPDQSMLGIELSQMRLDKEGGVAFTWPGLGASYEGTVSADGKEITGHWKQGSKTELRFRVFGGK